DTNGMQADKSRQELSNAVKAKSNIRVLSDAMCSGLFADNWLPVIRGNRLYKLRAKAVVVATGVIEQPSVFRNNDLPGVMFASAAQRLIRLYGVKPGNEAVILAANDSGYAAALDLQEVGITVSAIVDLRPQPRATDLTRGAQ